MPPKKKAAAKKKEAKTTETARDVEIYVLQRKVEALQHRIALKDVSMLTFNTKIEGMQNAYIQTVQ